MIEAVDLNGEPQPFESVTNPLVDVYTSLSGEPNVVWIQMANTSL